MTGRTAIALDLGKIPLVPTPKNDISPGLPKYKTSYRSFYSTIGGFVFRIRSKD
jgi:hypothetical protein